MPEGPEKLRTLVEQLRREVLELKARLAPTPERLPELRRHRNPRIARTVKGPAAEYPAQADCPNTYWIVFTDSTFPAAVGQQAITSIDRQTPAYAKVLAHNLIHGIEAYVPEGTEISVHFDNGRWWFVYYGATPCESDGSQGSDSDGGDGTTIDVLICGPWNRCGNYLIFPQRRIHLPPGRQIDILPDSVVPIYQCQSSGGNSDDESLGESSGTDDCISCLRVSGTLSPDATGDYYPLGYRIGGRCVWKEFGTSWYIVWNPTSNSWLLLNIDVGPGGGEYWIKPGGGGPMGAYGPGPNVEGLATVGACDQSSG